MLSRHVRALTAAAVAAASLPVVLTAVLTVTTAPAQAASGDCTNTGAVRTCTFTPNGAEQTFTVPAGTTSVTVVATGAAGARGDLSPGAPGLGARATRTLTVSAGRVLYVEVGGLPTNDGSCAGQELCVGGFNGGGSSLGGRGGGGGGASDVRTVAAAGNGSLESRVLVGGAGGGSGRYAQSEGSAGGDAGRPGGDTTGRPGSGGGAGTQVSGGAGSGGGTSGSLGVGGSDNQTNQRNAGGGGGGGGYYGGGAGDGIVFENGLLYSGGGGGGGSSYDPDGGAAPVVTSDPASVTISFALSVPTLTGTATSATRYGDLVSDSVRVTGGSNPTGTVSFALYGRDDTTCAAAPVFTSVAPLSAGSATSTAFRPQGAGSYRWTATYSGDAANASEATACGAPGQTSTVAQAGTSTVLAAAPNPARAGSPVTLTATVGSVRSTQTGTVSITRDSVSIEGCQGLPLDASLQARCTTSDLPAGSSTLVATYSGDRDSASSTGPPLVFTGNRAMPTLTPAAESAAAYGGPIRLAVTLSGSYRPTDVTTASVFAPGDTTCTGTPVDTTDFGLDGDRTYRTRPVFVGHAGTYRWTVTYPGDANNLPASVACGAPGAVSTVPQATSSTTLTADPAGGGTAGRPTYLTATVAATSAATGTVTIRDGDTVLADCIGLPVASGAATCTTSALAAGPHTLTAAYSGDDDTVTSSGMLSYTVSQASPTLDVQATSPTSYGGPIGVAATLTGGAAPGGTITFRLFGPADSTCSGRRRASRSPSPATGPTGRPPSVGWAPAPTAGPRPTAATPTTRAPRRRAARPARPAPSRRPPPQPH